MPGPAEINALAAVLDTDAAYLMCLALGYSKQQLDLVRNWNTLPENLRQQYFNRIEALSLTYRNPLPDEKLTPGFKAPAPQQIVPTARRRASKTPRS